MRVENSYAPSVGERVSFEQDIVIPKLKWSKLSKIFTATTTLNYINIGFLLPENDYGGVHGSYYYIDDILVIPAAERKDTTAETPKKAVILPPKKSVLNLDIHKKGATVVLENIQFETAKAILLPLSFAELDKIVAVLTENASLRLEIQGHTDNTGTAVANQSLSEKRAEAVYRYLTEKGIPKERLTHKGYGDTQPILPNTTPENRAKNRRVTCKVL